MYSSLAAARDKDNDLQPLKLNHQFDKGTTQTKKQRDLKMDQGVWLMSVVYSPWKMWRDAYNKSTTRRPDQYFLPFTVPKHISISNCQRTIPSN